MGRRTGQQAKTVKKLEPWKEIRQEAQARRTFNGGLLLDARWERTPMNQSSVYRKSPVCKYYEQKGEFDASEDKFKSRTINRRLKMRDTFSKINPLYTHEPNTCYMMKSFSHAFHPAIDRDIEGRPLRDISKEYNHKMDEMKNYSEEMYKLGSFAPPPRKAANKMGILK
jgi:hypothetical protein